MELVLKCFDGDIYITTKFKDQATAWDYIHSIDTLKMPNGDHIRSRTVDKVISMESYQFQAEMKQKVKQGQYLRNGKWHDNQGLVGGAGLERITGEIIDVKRIEKNFVAQPRPVPNQGQTVTKG